MKKEYDFERSERIKNFAVDCAYNILMIIIALFTAFGAARCIIDFDIPTKQGSIILLVAFVGGCCIYQFHKEVECYRKTKTIERHLKEPKFKDLTNEQIREIIMEIKYLL